MSTFTEFGLARPILDALASEGYSTPTAIQSQAIPQILNGRDLCGIAQTGTGKTAAFALPTLHRLAENPGRPRSRTCRALVLSPTRELAGQIADSFSVYGRHMPLGTAVVFGGVPIGKQERRLARGVDVLVATPGRLLDLIERRSLSLDAVEVLVLDEADQMMDLGFIQPLKRIVRLLPKNRQTLFFSATMPKTIASLAEEFLDDPVQVAVTPVATTAERVEQNVIFVHNDRKQALLASLLTGPEIARALVFTRTKHGADRVVRRLHDAGLDAAAIHGDKSQGQRERALGAFRNGNCRVLVATDIAARGIDVEGVTHVINFELPNVAESYVHRIGRTARAGAAGVAISFCSRDEQNYLRDIEKLTRALVPVMTPPEGFATGMIEPTRTDPTQARPSGGRPPRRDGPAKGARGQQRQRTFDPMKASDGRPPRNRSSRRRKYAGPGGESLPGFAQRSPSPDAR